MNESVVEACDGAALVMSDGRGVVQHATVRDNRRAVSLQRRSTRRDGTPTSGVVPAATLLVDAQSVLFARNGVLETTDPVPFAPAPNAP